MVLFGQFASWLILGYQRFISPHKGFCCAYRYYTGRHSCSEYGRKIARRYGLIALLRGLPRQFKRCKAAKDAIDRASISSRYQSLNFSYTQTSQSIQSTQYMTPPPPRPKQSIRQKCGESCGRNIRACFSRNTRNTQSTKTQKACDIAEDAFDVCDVADACSDAAPCDCSW